MADWVDYYIDNEGYENNNRAFGFTGREIESVMFGKIDKLLKEIIRQCANKEEDFNAQNFRRLKITVAGQYCFSTIRKLESKKDSKYEYLILLPQNSIMKK